MSFFRNLSVIIIVPFFLIIGSVNATEIRLKNSDRLTGEIVSMER
jgi:hypothetical protein